MSIRWHVGPFSGPLTRQHWYGTCGIHHTTPRIAGRCLDCCEDAQVKVDKAARWTALSSKEKHAEISATAAAVLILMGIATALVLLGVGVYALVHLNKRTIPETTGLSSTATRAQLAGNGLRNTQTWNCENGGATTRIAMGTDSFLGVSSPKNEELRAGDRVYVNSKIIIVCGG
jgi:hypothetical protein